MRKLIATLIITALAVPAFAVTPSMTWDGANQQCVANVTMTIPMWAQVICQDGDGITFSPSTATGYATTSAYNASVGDWWGTGPNGYYALITSAGTIPNDGKASTDPWAGAAYISGGTDLNPTGIYYEATDYAHHFVRTNTQITGTITFTPLTSGSNTLPTTCTAGFGLFWDAHSGAAAQVATTTIPDGAGGTLGGFLPNGAAGITLAGLVAQPQGLAGGESYVLTPPSWGTITLHSRVLRRGMFDVAGVYTGTITVSYTQP